MIIAAFLIDVESKTFIGIGGVTLLISSLTLLVFDYTSNWSVDFSVYSGFWTPSGFVQNLMFNGYHPILPWIGFIIIGLLIGRLDLNSKAVRKRLTLWSISIVLIVETISVVLIYGLESSIGLELATFLFSTKPMPPTNLYIIASSSLAVVATMIFIHIGEVWKTDFVKSSLISTGQMALTHYVLHVLGVGILEITGLIRIPSPWISTIFSFVLFLEFVVFSYIWSNHFNRGPLELVMRKVA